MATPCVRQTDRRGQRLMPISKDTQGHNKSNWTQWTVLRSNIQINQTEDLELRRKIRRRQKNIREKRHGRALIVHFGSYNYIHTYILTYVCT